MRLRMGNQPKKTEGGERWRGKKATNHHALEIGDLPPPVSCPIAGGGGGGDDANHPTLAIVTANPKFHPKAITTKV